MDIKSEQLNHWLCNQVLHMLTYLWTKNDGTCQFLTRKRYSVLKVHWRLLGTFIMSANAVPISSVCVLSMLNSLANYWRHVTVEHTCRRPNAIWFSSNTLKICADFVVTLLQLCMYDGKHLAHRFRLISISVLVFAVVSTWFTFKL